MYNEDRIERLPEVVDFVATTRPPGQKGRRRMLRLPGDHLLRGLPSGGPLLPFRQEKEHISQSFEPCELDAGDEYQQKMWNLAVKDQDAAALCNQDLLVVHAYAGDAETGVFAERYPSSMVKPDRLGGAGGGSLTMPVSCTFGGRREKGTAAVTDTGVVFTKEA